jgi:hypothetical protein
VKLTRLVALCAAWAFLTPALAQKVSVVCPLDGERFGHEAPSPLTSRETYLDQRPVDAWAPWPHAKCPASGFVVYKSEFTAAELAKLRPIVASDKYRALAATHTTHYLEAVLRRELGETPYAVAWALVQAS